MRRKANARMKGFFVEKHSAEMCCPQPEPVPANSAMCQHGASITTLPPEPSTLLLHAAWARLLRCQRCSYQATKSLPVLWSSTWPLLVGVPGCC